MKIFPFQQEALLAAAREIQSRAYVPYSNFPVGAAFLTVDGEIFTGVNVENASFGLTVCAERNAIGAMVAAGEREIAAAAVASPMGVTPCGACRQVMREFGQDIPVWLINTSTDEVRETSLNQLLPDSFTGDQLPPA